MHIKTIIEQSDGNYEFNAVLTPDQHAFLIEFAVKELLAAGLIPFASSEKAASVQAAVATEQ